jgi:hypothetical protein
MNQKDQDQVDILEIDGPPRSHFEIPIRGESLGLTGQGPHDIAFVERIVYLNFGLNGPTCEAVEDRRDAILAAVRAELGKFGGGIIWWRKRPETTKDFTADRVHVSMRFGTSPILAANFWDSVEMSASDYRRTEVPA